MMEHTFAYLEERTTGHQRRLRDEAAEQRLARSAVRCDSSRSAIRRGGAMRPLRAALAAALVAVAAWLDERYAERELLPGSWARMA